MANTNGAAAPELAAELAPLGGLELLDSVRVEYGEQPQQWITAAAAQGMLARLFATRRTLFLILLAEYHGGITLRAPAGTKQADR